MSRSPKTYDREDEVFGKESTITLAQAVGLAQECLRVLPPMPMPGISVSPDKGFEGGTTYYDDRGIVVGTHMTPSLIVHEVAHHAAFHMYGQPCAHGKEWVQCYAHLAGHIFGPEFKEELLVTLAFARSAL